MRCVTRDAPTRRVSRQLRDVFALCAVALTALLGCGRERGADNAAVGGNGAASGVGGGASGAGESSGGAATGPQLLYDLGTARAVALEADEQYLYWAEAGPFRITRAPKSGAGPSEELGPWAGGELTKSMFAVDQTAVYWLDDSVVRKRNKADGALSTIEIGRPPVEGGWFMTADSDYLYVADRDANQVVRVAKSGGELQPYTTTPRPTSSGSYLAVDSDSLYVGNNRDLLRFPKQGGAATTLAQVKSGEMFGAVVSDDRDVYWANNREILATREENLAMLPKAGGAIADLGVIGDGTAIMRLDTSKGRLYWTTKGGTSRDRVLTFSLADAKLDVMSMGQPIYGGMAQDERYVYWCGETSVMRLAK